MTQKTLMTVTVLIGLLGGTLTAFAYLHSTFVNKDIFQVLQADIREIKADVKSLMRDN